ncbi:MAG: OB-fold nucleic acid binding domain-containing protein, partial [Pseudomonadota bacterium]
MTETTDENKLIAQRRSKLNELRAAGPAFPNDFRRDALAAALHAEHDATEGEDLEARGIRVTVAGRMVGKRVMGKASFIRLRDQSGDIQLFAQRDSLPEGVYAAFKHWDLGDIVGGQGTLFRTQ